MNSLLATGRGAIDPANHFDFAAKKSREHDFQMQLPGSFTLP
jgi:hypothetical protein